MGIRAVGVAKNTNWPQVTRPMLPRMTAGERRWHRAEAQDRRRRRPRRSAFVNQGRATEDIGFSAFVTIGSMALAVAAVVGQELLK